MRNQKRNWQKRMQEKKKYAIISFSCVFFYLILLSIFLTILFCSMNEEKALLIFEYAINSSTLGRFSSTRKFLHTIMYIVVYESALDDLRTRYSSMVLHTVLHNTWCSELYFAGLCTVRLRDKYVDSFILMTLKHGVYDF